MKFKDIAVKNFKVNFKKYISYFLCSAFSVMLFFMYSSLLFNQSLHSQEENQEAINIVFSMSLTVIALFSAFFINYAHTSFIKSRYKEFGIYLTLGMTQKDIGRIIWIENLIIIFSSMAAGLLSGIIFSRLFQMIVASILHFDGFIYSLNPVSFVLTVGVFALIFLFVLALSRLATQKFEIGELLKKSRQAEGRIVAKFLPGLLGVCVLFLSLLLFIWISGNDKLNNNFLLVIPNVLLMFAGVFLTISYMGMSAMAMIKRNRKSYYRHVLLVTEIAQKFNQNKKIIFILSILSSMIVFFVASPFSLLSLSEKISGMNQPNDLEFSTAYGVNEIDDETIENLMRSTDAGVVSQSEVEFLALGFSTSGHATDLLNQKPAVSAGAYNLLTDSNIEVPKGTVYNAVTTWLPGNTGIAQNDTVTIATPAGNMEFTVLDSARAPWVASGNAFPSGSGLIFNDQDYGKIKANIGGESICTYHIFRLQDWKKSENTVARLKETLAEINARNPSSIGDDGKLFTVLSRMEAYQILKQTYSLFIFVTAIMGILFFIAAGSVLFFKQYTEIDSARQKYYRLYKIGITQKEAKGIITKELLITFFTPLVFGSIMGYSFINFMTNLVGGEGVLGEFMLNATKVVIAYFLFQAIFFLITRKKYISEVLTDA